MTDINEMKSRTIKIMTFRTDVKFVHYDDGRAATTTYRVGEVEFVHHNNGGLTTVTTTYRVG